MALDSRTLAAISGDDDLLLLSLMQNDEKHQPILHLQDISDSQYKQLFRFDRPGLLEIQSAMGFPEFMSCPNRTKFNIMEGLHVLIRRLSYPNRLEDLSFLFGRTKFELSNIFNTTLDFIYEKYERLLLILDRPWLSPGDLDAMTTAVSDKGSPLDNCLGSIDGTIRPICRPRQNQRVVYSGHKRVHGLKFQSIMAPNGIIAHFYGPIEGRRHDAGMLRESGVETEMQHMMNRPNNDVFCVYGDPAYPLTPYIVPPFRGAVISANQARFNKKMSAVRVCVEWGFGKLLSLFAFLDYKKNQKLYLQPIGKYYKVAVILTNCHTCLYGSETSTYFGLRPPTVQEYLQL
ncbi:hypothetical protein FSP39_007238 [Pinctada imbricata]|uniref:DDE Tnp4 domain-containing protein n=1 Tax=Pinctada imbricata TaxID=66713 RepID=A0AA88XLA9_PINIB|nr:hypothetical protein FSP39_007238 [Pinctada imbricata]